MLFSRMACFESVKAALSLKTIEPTSTSNEEGDLEPLTKPDLARWVKMARPLLPDGLWAEIAPLLLPGRGKPKGSRPRTSDRAALVRRQMI